LARWLYSGPFETCGGWGEPSDANAVGDDLPPFQDIPAFSAEGMMAWTELPQLPA
jgi:hypothetical protein